MSFFSAQGLFAGFGGCAVLEGVSFTAAPGSITGILGANGSGKSTLLSVICGALPHTGQCFLEGRALETLPVRQLARLCGYIPQRSGVGIDISALDVVLMGFNSRLGLLERPGTAMQAAARAALAEVGLAGREQQNYLTLSEGQKQLCILARALACGGKLLLLDEPESALDLAHRYRMLALLRRWVRGEADGSACEEALPGCVPARSVPQATPAYPRAVIMALHDPNLALACCDQLLLLQDGRIQAALCPARDPLPAMEEALSRVYGGVALARCSDRTGRQHLVMLKEWEDCP